MKGKIRTLSEKLRDGLLTSETLTKHYLDRIRAVDNDINAYITVTEDEALESAGLADKAIAEGRSDLLCGIPMSVKDNISTKGVLTTCASKILSNYKPVFDATAVEKLKNAGAVMLGKTNLDEFGMGSTCENSFYGITKNPHDTSCVPGGSSGGLAASVASETCVYGIGSDTGGSIRQPASFCGMVGLKPTYGAVSRYGLIAYASSLDQIGIIAGSTEDVSLVFDTIAGYDNKDATSSAAVREQTFGSLQNDIKGVRIGLPQNLMQGLSAEIAECFERALDTFTTLGAVIVPITIEQIENAISTYYILACAEASSNLARYDSVRYGFRAKDFEDVDDMITKTRTEGFGAEVQRRIMLGNYVLSSGYYDAYYKKAQLLQNDVLTNFKNAFAEVDAVFCPTVANTAFKIGSVSKNPVEMYLTDLYTVPVNIAGMPAINVPAGFSSDGMPVGLQLIGDRFNEAKLLNLAYAFEDLRQADIYKKGFTEVKI